MSKQPIKPQERPLPPSPSPVIKQRNDQPDSPKQPKK